MKIMLIGASAAGKTTLIQRLKKEEIKYDKTQAVEYVGNFIDTPGEYMQQRGFWGSLTTTSHDADIIGLVQDSASDDCWFSPGTATKFDLDESKIRQARGYLELAGCNTIYEISSYTGEGIDELSKAFHEIVDKYRKDNARSYEQDYFD